MGEMILDDLQESPDALRRLQEGLSQCKRVVFTNGCFDILHVGHLRYLKAAKALGDCLVVALNSDASVRGLKGPTRPLVPEAERAELMAALEPVDWVVLFDEPSPVNLLKMLRPHVYVKGAQYNEENLPETPVLKELGTDIAFVPMVDGRSTTAVVDKIKAALSLESCPAP
jgi:rfaE bifunctional protein nucleotidyltransferase chain/domain